MIIDSRWVAAHHGNAKVARELLGGHTNAQFGQFLYLSFPRVAQRVPGEIKLPIRSKSAFPGDVRLGHFHERRQIGQLVAFQECEPQFRHGGQRRQIFDLIVFQIEPFEPPQSLQRGNVTDFIFVEIKGVQLRQFGQRLQGFHLIAAQIQRPKGLQTLNSIQFLNLVVVELDVLQLRQFCQRGNIDDLILGQIQRLNIDALFKRFQILDFVSG